MKFINYSNHPSCQWSQEQRKASEQHGTIEDMQFPVISASWNENAIGILADEETTSILAKQPAAVLCQGEFIFIHALIRLLKQHRISVLVASGER